MRGGGFVPLRKGILCVQRMGWNGRSRNNCGTAFDFHERLPSAKLGGVSRLGAYTNLDRAQKGCVYIKVGIIVAVTGGGIRE